MSEEFAKEQVQKREERRMKNIIHVEQVKEQMKEVPRTFAKTGIAIIK
jgi:repressor of nif and glnA expression